MSTVKVPAVKCKAKAKSTGKRCRQWAIPGGTVCPLHGGKASQVKAKAAVRAEVFAWGLDDEYVDPGETLLKLVAQSARRANRLGAELELMVAEHDGNVATAMLEDTMFGKKVHALVKLESDERDRCASFSAKAVAAGIAERQVRLAERQEELAVALLRAALDQLGLPDDREREIVANAYLAVTSSPSA